MTVEDACLLIFLEMDQRSLLQAFLEQGGVPVIIALGRLREEDLELEFSLGYSVKLCL